MNETRKCTVCHEVKALGEFPEITEHLRRNVCRVCHNTQKAADMRARRATQSKEEKAAAQAAYRAGIRKDRCAVCGDAIEGQGFCKPCTTAITLLGGTPDALKAAAKALKWLQEQ